MLVFAVQTRGGVTTFAFFHQTRIFATGGPFCGATDLAKFQRAMSKLTSHMMEGLIGGLLDEIPHVWEEHPL
jgi:hypothetical protein